MCIWRQLNKFIIKLDYKEHLSWEERTALFGAYLVDKGVQSLKSYFSTIKFILRQDGYPWDESKALLSSLVRGCKLENDALKVRLPIQKGLLEILLFEIERMFGGSNNPQPYLESLYKAIFCLAYYGMLRVGELTQSNHTVLAKNIHVAHNKDKIMVVLYTSKTHGQESKPQRVKISGVPGCEARYKSQFFCPFRTVTTYMNIRGCYKEESDQFFCVC